ncbi:MAG: LysM peptidoglycan-binding domain-containing protein [Firmicutes bacterium]|nr:LysM peptidoglycan-binding domain-containing protein [Bacillota bacterium]
MADEALQLDRATPLLRRFVGTAERLFTVSGEVPLPEAVKDIQAVHAQVVHLRAVPRDGEVTFEGWLMLTFRYLPSTAEGINEHRHFLSFTTSIDLPAAKEGDSLTPVIAVRSCQATRVPDSSARFTVTVDLWASAEAFRSEPAHLLLNVSGSGVEVARERLSTEECVSQATAFQEINTIFVPAIAAAQVERVLVQIEDLQETLSADRVVVRGVEHLWILYRSPENATHVESVDQRFTLPMEVEGAAPGMRIYTTALPGEVQVDMEQPDRLILRTPLSIHVEVTQLRDFDVVTDVFGPVDLARAPLSYDGYVGEGQASTMLENSYAVEYPVGQVTRESSTATVGPNGLSVEEDRVVVEGIVYSRLTYVDVEGVERERQLQEPFSLTVQVGGARQGMVARAQTSVIAISQEIDPDNRNQITLHREIQTRVTVLDPQRIQIVRDVIAVHEPTQQALHIYRYYFVQPGESLFDVAKRYGLPQVAIEAINELAPNEPLRFGQRLKIPVPDDQAS